MSVHRVSVDAYVTAPTPTWPCAGCGQYIAVDGRAHRIVDFPMVGCLLYLHDRLTAADSCLRRWLTANDVDAVIRGQPETASFTWQPLSFAAALAHTWQRTVLRTEEVTVDGVPAVAVRFHDDTALAETARLRPDGHGGAQVESVWWRGTVAQLAAKPAPPAPPSAPTTETPQPTLCFAVTLKGYSAASLLADADRLPEEARFLLEDTVKRVVAPSRDALDRFIARYRLGPILDAEPYVMPGHHTEGVDVTVDAAGQIVSQTGDLASWFVLVLCGKGFLAYLTRTPAPVPASDSLRDRQLQEALKDAQRVYASRRCVGAVPVADASSIDTLLAGQIRLLQAVMALRAQTS